MIKLLTALFAVLVPIKLSLLMMLSMITRTFLYSLMMMVRSLQVIVGESLLILPVPDSMLPRELERPLRRASRFDSSAFKGSLDSPLLMMV